MSEATTTATATTSTDARLSAIFPDLGRPTPFRRTRRARLGVAVVTAVALTGAGIAAAGASGSEIVHLRTATVGIHDVESLLRGVASVEAVSQAAVAFPVAGTVSAVNVGLGDRVVVGQTLATVDAEGLEQTLHTRQATLAQAELTLSKALAGESTAIGPSGAAGTTTGSARASSTTTTTTVATSVAPPTTTPNTTGAGGSTTDATALRTAQQAVLDAQRAVDAALGASTAALDAANSVCDDGATPAPASTTTSTTVPDPGAELTACRTALADVLAAQQSTAVAQHDLAASSTALDALLTTAAGSIDAASSTGGSSRTTTPTTVPATASPATASTTPSSTGSTTSSAPSAEQLIADQRAVDAAGLDVIVATHALEQTSITAPIAGTVVGVGLAVGDATTADSATQAVTIVGDGGFEVTTTVPVDRVTSVAVGQRATVDLDGSDIPITGAVVSISVGPDTASTATSYRVVIGLGTASGSMAESDDDAAPALHNGATGTVELVTKETTSTLAVPTSAVTTTGSTHTVRLATGTGSKDVEIGVGVVGATWTEVTKGLRSGQRVVIADLDADLPGSATAAATASTNGGTNGTGQGSGFPAGFGGGAFPDGGSPPGARPTG